MATPTPGSASKRTAGGVLTPSHLNHSPPRSVPSPVAARHPAGKTPINHPTSSSQGSKTIGSTPVVHGLSQNGSTASPSANILSFSTPNGLGIEGVTPAGLNIPTPALGSVAMLQTMSELGLTASGGKRNEDEERRTKMRRVLKAIGKPKGRVSEEGIARISRRVGFANDVDAEKLTPEEKERKVGNRPISTAGNTIVIDIDLKNHVPRSVQVSYSVQTKALDEQGEKASKVLLHHLKATDGVALQAKLDKFAVNLESLARIDRLSSSGVNGFEALAGIYASLQRLYEQELKAVQSFLKVDLPDKDRKAETEVRRRRSGRPVMHERGKIGLAIEYWSEQYRAGHDQQKADSEDKMEVDGQESAKSDVDYHGSDNLFSLTIEAQASAAALYPSVRVSDAWLPEQLQLPPPESGEGIPWQDPPPALVAADTAGDPLAIAGQQKLPDLRFVAKLDPPLVMPYQTAMNILAAVGVTQAPVAQTPLLQYAALLLDPHGPNPLQQAQSFATTSEREVLSQANGAETTVKYQYTLDSVKLDWGFSLEEIPFSHPRQLVELLPTLRQWACVASLLLQTFRPAPDHSVLHTAETSLDDLLEDRSADSDTIQLPVTIALATSPTPTLGITWPSNQQNATANVTLQVLPNAHLTITSQEGLSSAVSDATGTKMQKLAKALESCEDLGVWLEWLRSTLKP